MNVLNRKNQAIDVLRQSDAHNLLRRVQKVLLDGKGVIDIFDTAKQYERAIALGFGPRQPTATVTPIQLEPTWTASPTLELTPNNTPRPTFTPFATNTPFSLLPPTKTPRPPTPTRTPKAPFSHTVSQVESTLIHPDLSCNWAGTGGTVVDANNSPIIGQVIVLRGLLDGKTIEQQTVSGINKEYGPSGFEFVLGNAPFASTTLVVQLVDLNNLPLSAPISITTSSDCKQNLVLVRFKKNK